MTSIYPGVHTYRCFILYMPGTPGNMVQVPEHKCNDSKGLLPRGVQMKLTSKCVFWFSRQPQPQMHMAVYEMSCLARPWTGFVIEWVFCTAIDCRTVPDLISMVEPRDGRALSPLLCTVTVHYFRDFRVCRGEVRIHTFVCPESKLPSIHVRSLRFVYVLLTLAWKWAVNILVRVKRRSAGSSTFTRQKSVHPSQHSCYRFSVTFGNR